VEVLPCSTPRLGCRLLVSGMSYGFKYGDSIFANSCLWCRGGGWAAGGGTIEGACRPGGPTKGVAGTLLDPWVEFCTTADGGGEVALAAAAEGVAASIARQLRYVSVGFCIYIYCFLCWSWRIITPGDGLR
jgi:hypothetical protein